jgi:hypothetical protein
LNEIGPDLGGGAGKLPHAGVRARRDQIDGVEAAALAHAGCEPVPIPQQAQSGLDR